MKKKTLVSVTLVSLLLWAAILSLVGWWWTVMAAWALVVLVLVYWLYERVKREEDAPRYAMPVRVITGAEQRELEREQSEFNARRLPPDEDEPFALDEPNQPRPAA